ncbi:hypothetical protein EA658_16480 [Pseudoxanthomonas winnipegensis]|uniref:Uncharacterized protein n=1 Tax=Pseudoxanthomonas winnipegensis TaxID=2480810 RepID=A0ABY1WCE7_9GAMM|nr:hypothetical protein [Pseudoxanthomonas winnipegensis]TAA11259.1 hypothetical protein EA659_07895 [Pseudoxanthomonas winnipegensis]TAA18682.1 hypothetical protein EA658_16480 [Pseudoxanthomonas winnipegensis]TAH73942.1 hypothetical protein EA657_00265 [Pseudoxanthomonas winnipegensis]
MSISVSNDTKGLMASQIMAAYLQNDELMDRFKELADSDGHDMFMVVAVMATSHVAQLLEALHDEEMDSLKVEDPTDD